MTLSPDILTLGVPDLQAAHAFYSAVFSPDAEVHGDHVTFDMHGTGRIALYETEAKQPRSGFPGYTLNYTVNQPGEVESLLATATKAGATVLKPGKKSLFAGFSAVFQAPDGAVWKLATPTRKDTGLVEAPPKPTETVVILGVDSPKASRDFYTGLGMTVDRDYGNKFIDFQLTPGQCRVGLMTRKSLAKDAGARDNGDMFGGNVLEFRVETRDEVDALLSAAVAGGGRIAREASEAEPDGYSGQFNDPDGWTWRVATASQHQE